MTKQKATIDESDPRARAKELAITYRSRDELRPFDRNARTHSEDQVRQIAASMKEFGWTNPLLINGEGDVIAGHGRLLAAELVGLDQVPCIVLDHLTEPQRRALVLADNQIALNAGWDLGLLRDELVGLSGLGFDLDLLGFENHDLVTFMATPRVGDPELVPDIEEVVISRPGDCWTLGQHRIICGSSTDAETVAALLGDEVPHLMVTDPPYGVEYDPAWRTTAKNADGASLSIGKHALGLVQNDGRADWSEAWKLFPGDVAYVWHAGNKAGEVEASLASCGFEVRAQIIWNKSVHIIGRDHYHPKHEPCFYTVRKGRSGHWAGDRKQNTVWDIQNMHRTQGNVDDGKTNHSTQKPVECMRRPILNNSKPGDLVYEPFSGSGTTIIACEQENRRCRAIELSPAYVDLAVRRWQAFTGDRAVLQSTGQPFPQNENDSGKSDHSA